MNDSINRRETIRLYCREHCGCEPEECGCTLERDGVEECEFVRFLKSVHSAQLEPSQVARDIATIIENERDMRVMLSQPEIIRCKDCKHHEIEEPGMVYCKNIVGGWVSDDFYCADAERRTE